MTVEMNRPVAAALLLLFLGTGCIPAEDTVGPEDTAGLDDTAGLEDTAGLDDTAGLPDGGAGAEGSPRVTIIFNTRTGGQQVGNPGCYVSVPAHSTGLQVLEAAVLLACIDSYTLKTQYGRRMVECIDQVCEAGPNVGVIPATRWFVMGRWAETYRYSGVNGYATASNGDEFTLDLRVVN